jgi:histone H3
MRNKAVPEKKRSWLGGFGSGIGSGKKLVEAAKQKISGKLAASGDTETAHDASDSNVASAVPMLTADDAANKKASSSQKKAHRFKPGTVALREIKKAQSDRGNSGASVSRLDAVIREIASKVTTGSSARGEAIRFQPKALAALREAAEQFETEILRLGNTLSIHRGKMTLHKKDLALASSLILAPHVGQEQNGSKKLLGGVLQIMRRVGADSVGNARKSIAGRDRQTSRALRTYTQETAHDVVADPPGLDDEEARAQADIEKMRLSKDDEGETDDEIDEDEMLGTQM